MSRRRYRMEQPQFLSIWMKRLGILLGCVLMISLLGTNIAVHYYRNYVEKDYTMQCNTIINQVENWNNDIYSTDSLTGGQQIGLWKSAIRWIRDSASGSLNGGIAFDIYREDRQEAFVPQEDVNYIILSGKDETGKTYIYNCPNRIIQSVLDEYDQLYDNSKLLTEIYVDDIYINGGNYIPGEIEIRQWNGTDHDTYSTVKKYSFAPTIKSAFTHIEVGSKGYRLLGPLRFEPNKQDKVARQLLQDYTKKDCWRGEKVQIGEGLWDDDQELSGKTWDGIEYISTQSRNIGGMLLAKVVVAAHYSLFEDYGKWMILVYCSLVGLAFVVSLGIAYYTYMVRKNRYEMDRYRRETTNAMAHDLKTPLTAISGYAENLIHKVHTEKTEYYCKAILENARYMNEMVSNILELAKAESISRTMAKETISVGSLITRCEEKYESLLEEAGLEIQMHGEAVIKADASAMMQVMENLIGNAIKYAKERTTIQVYLTTDMLRITNTMAGKLDVPAEELVKPFVKGDNSRKGMKGSGVGLAIVKNIVEESGYRLSVQCEDDNFLVVIHFG